MNGRRTETGIKPRRASRAPSALDSLWVLAAAEPITLAVAAHDTDHSNSTVLRDLLLHGGG